MDPALRKVCVRGDGRAGPGARTHLPASSVAERLLLRRRAFDRQVQLPLPLEPHDDAQVLDPRRVGLSGVQSHFQLVRPRELLHRFCEWPARWRLKEASDGMLMCSSSSFFYRPS